MLIATIILATLLVAMVILLALEDRKNDVLLKQIGVLRKQADEAKEADEAPMACRKPLTEESIRTALRFNGYSPEIPDTREPGEILFKLDDTMMRIITPDLPLLAITTGFTLDEPEWNQPLLQKASEDVTKHIYIGKVCLADDGKAVFFSVEFYCESYVEFRDRLKDYLRIIKDTGRHFFEAYDKLKGDARKERESVFSGESFLQAAQANSKKIQS